MIGFSNVKEFYPNNEIDGFFNINQFKEKTIMKTGQVTIYI